MIDLIKSTILDNYPNCITTVKNISYDSENDFALCNSEFISINYEKLIKDILKAEHTVPDMLHFHKNKLIFVEFKNAYWIYVNILDKNLSFSGDSPPPLTNHS